ncbi:MAG: fructose-6-phosphate aldolase [Chloroflexi bacterium]|nr:fructose-6-phosphate aldolase [Chloroflexota bacterium]MCL5110546.1 fructose-6-phosphate aldolase [Chloroflexota bacterium]
MRIFLDTANLEEIRQAAAWGVVSGVTTNPSLMAKEKGADFQETIREICSLIDGPISAEVTALDTEGMIAQARDQAKWHRNVVIKVPITPAGLGATKVLSAEGISTNLTLCFSTNQALLAAAAGATYVSPFLGRLDDIGHDGIAVVAEIVSVYKNYGLRTQVIAASIRHPLHVVAAAKAGAHIATIPYKVLTQMVEHPLTKNGLDRFMADWASRK